jgi:CheY-like chemotaxis protein
MIIKERFVESLRDALAHLYDPNRLRQSPLVPLFGLADQHDPPLALQRLLTEAIVALEPEPDVPSHAPAWRIYDLLFCRYVQQLAAEQVANQLGLSIRQMRRTQHGALEALAHRLQGQLAPGAEMDDTGPQPTASISDAGATVDEELGWLRHVTLDEPTSLAKELPVVLDLVRPLVIKYRIHLEVEPAHALPALAVHQTALNQMLLNLISVAVSQSVAGRVVISARCQQHRLEVSVRGESLVAAQKTLSRDDMANLDITQKLAHLCGGELILATNDGLLTATLALPTAEQLVVLAIDDNADTLQLLQRYTVGTRYHLIGTREPDGIPGLADRHCAHIIVLDVMMPRVDGWQILGQLRQHPLTSHIPIIVCTILAQEELALALGASRFVRKPLTQQAFLEALNQVAQLVGQADARAPGYC